MFLLSGEKLITGFALGGLGTAIRENCHNTTRAFPGVLTPKFIRPDMYGR